jgi:hypothetical protein
MAAWVNDRSSPVRPTAAQSIDGGDGNDTIRHYRRTSASTITTARRSDTIELAMPTSELRRSHVTTFTPGPGGDIFRLDGERRALLSLLIDWDGSSNPFGSSGLPAPAAERRRHRARSGTGTARPAVLTGKRSSCFENTDVGDFTNAQLRPAIRPTDHRRPDRQLPAPITAKR